MTGGLRPMGLADLDEVVRLRVISFGGDAERAREQEHRSIEAGQTWGLLDGRHILGTTRLAVLDHWFGGRRVPCQHVSGVAVPPEHRGRGVASALMRGVVDRGVLDGATLSLLYPATTALYRRLGWEHAGTLARYTMDARLAPGVPGVLRPAAGEADWAAIRACHRETGRQHNGPTVRDERGWQRLRDTPFVYVLDGEDGQDGVEAYLCYGQQADPGDWQFSIEITDWGVTTPRGLASLLGFVGRHGTIGKQARMTGPLPHSWTFLVPEQDVDRSGGMFWMARALDLPGAIAARGFAPGLSLDVTLAVEDRLVPAARGPWRLEVSGAAAKLAPADHADVTLDARAVGPLYTGFTSVTQLALAGLAQGPPDALALLGAAFAGSAPVLFDFF